MIINEGLWDKEFVEKYVHGWDEFVERVNEYPLDRVQEITWVPAENIRAAARLYATTKPACIQWGVAFEQTINSTDNNRILTDLMAITGNLDVPGGNVVVPPGYNEVRNGVPAADVTLHDPIVAQRDARRAEGDVRGDRVELGAVGRAGESAARRNRWLAEGIGSARAWRPGCR